MAFAQVGQIEVVDPSTVMMRGYAAITGNEFEYFDPWQWKRRRMTIDPGAFSSVLGRLGDTPLPIHWRHRTCNLQLGETTELGEDDTGLFFGCDKLFTHSEAVDIITTIDGRSHTGASILFEFGEVAEDDDGLEHVLSFSNLFEVGPSPEGANPQAYTELVELPSSEQAESEPEPAAASIDISTDAAMAATIYRAAAQLRRF